MSLNSILFSLAPLTGEKAQTLPIILLGAAAAAILAVVIFLKKK